MADTEKSGPPAGNPTSRVAEPQDKKSYLDVEELSARTGFSASTLWRMKKAGKIPYYQPGGWNCAVRFPEDAIELMRQCEPPAPEHEGEQQASSRRLPGPLPKWMSQSNRKQ